MLRLLEATDPTIPVVTLANELDDHNDVIIGRLISDPIPRGA